MLRICRSISYHRCLNGLSDDQQSVAAVKFHELTVFRITLASASAKCDIRVAMHSIIKASNRLPTALNCPGTERTIKTASQARRAFHSNSQTVLLNHGSDDGLCRYVVARSAISRSVSSFLHLRHQHRVAPTTLDDTSWTTMTELPPCSLNHTLDQLNVRWWLLV